MTIRKLAMLLMPLYALQVFSGHKAFDTPVVGSRRLNKRGLHVWRMRVTHRIAASRRRRLAHLISAEDHSFFARNGFVEKRNLLSAQDYAALLGELHALAAPAREMVEGNAVTRRIAVTPDLLKRSPTLHKLLDTSEWRGLTRFIGGFDAEPTVCIQTIFGSASETDPQTRLHMDTFHPTMKAWYFLEEVEADQGPFTYVPGSHVASTRRMAWHKRRSVLACQSESDDGSFRVPESLPRVLGLPKLRIFAVPGNTLVVGDTFGLHARGRSARPSVRVEIYASMRPNPFVPFISLDKLLPSFIRRHKIQIGWWLEDIFVMFGLGKQIWKQVGLVGPWQKPTR